LHPAEINYGLIAEVLQQALECPVCTFSEVGSPDGALGLGWPVTEFPASEITAVTQRNMRRHPLIQHYVSTDDRRPLAVTDFTTLRQWRSSAVGSDIHSIVQFYDHLAIPLASPAGAMRAFALGRTDGAFKPQERRFVEALHPLLVSMDRKSRRHQRQIPGILTTREWQVIGLAENGLTSRLIARKLGISPRTVEKHLENAYRKLHADNRIDAVTRWKDTVHQKEQ
jgi:DNA-binding CsgD family transcriptional regulator